MTRPTALLTLVAVLLALPSQGLVIDPLAPRPSSTPLPLPGSDSAKRADGPSLITSRQEGVPNPEWPPNNNNNNSNTNGTDPNNGDPNDPNDPNNNPDNGDNGSGFPRSGPCSDEGLWICNDHSFQRCASGFWSPALDVAAGTECSPNGETDDFKIGYDNDQTNNNDTSSNDNRNGTNPSVNGATSAAASELDDKDGLAVSVLADGRTTAALMLGAWMLVLPVMLGWAQV